MVRFGYIDGPCVYRSVYSMAIHVLARSSPVHRTRPVRGRAAKILSGWYVHFLALFILWNVVANWREEIKASCHFSAVF